MTEINVQLNIKEAQSISDLIDNTLFNNGYDLCDSYLKALYDIKQKLDAEILRSKSENCLID